MNARHGPGGGACPGCEGRSSFLKKRSKKLLLFGVCPNGKRPPRHQGRKVFLLLFLQKKKTLPYLA
jgi:hypothetical protein